jgi:DNA-binding MarR family transcriptional regulator
MLEKKYSKYTLRKIFKHFEALFLNSLIYWSNHTNCYGIEKDKRVWIYNTLDEWAKQLKVSKSTVQRVIKSLKEQGLIEFEYLSKNKRDRTLFYSINYQKLEEVINASKPSVIRSNSAQNDHMVDHMVDHMYYNNNNNNNNINKSDESKISNKNKNIVINSSAKKPTIVQDMLKVWNSEFSNSNCILNKELAKFLVAAFKIKFKNSLKEWEKYIQLIKTSTYLMSNKFKLTIRWAIKFFTIDRLKSGDLGVDEGKIPIDQNSELKKALEHIESVDETKKCKSLREKVIKIFSPSIYNSWFKKISFIEIGEGVFMKQNDGHSGFLKDYIERHFCDQLELSFA